MKNNIKSFFRKVDPITFALVVMLGLSATFAWVQITQVPQEVPVLSQLGVDVEDDIATFREIAGTNVATLAIEENFIVPIVGDDFEVTVNFFDADADEAALVSSIFFYQVGQGKYSHQSQGMSFRGADDAVVNVVASLTGVVSSVVDDDPIRGTIVTIDHANGVQTVYTGVYDVVISVGDELEQGDVIGATGLSLLEPDNGNVVHIEVMKNGDFLNPYDLIGNSISEFE